MLAGLIAVAGAMSATAQTSDWQDGDVFVFSWDGAQYKVYDHDGVLKETIAVPSPYWNFEKGGAFRGNGDLSAFTYYEGPLEDYVYHVVTLDQVHPHPKTHDLNIESLGYVGSTCFDAHDNLYVSTLEFSPSVGVHKYNAAGVHQDMYPVANYDAGVSWIALSTDQHTLFYVANNGSGPSAVKSYDLTTHTQLPDVLTTSDWLNDLALLSPFDGSGGFIVVAGNALKRYDSAGALVQTYSYPGYGQFQAISLDPDGTSFWTIAKIQPDTLKTLVHLDLATGALVQDTQAIGNLNVFDVIVRGELVGGSLPPQFDAPTPCDRPLRAYVGVPVSYVVSGSDLNDGDTLTLTASNLPTGANVTPGLSGTTAQSTLDWTPAADQVGDHAITFTLTDFVGHSRTCTLLLTVEPGLPYCFGDGLDPNVTATCPCGNDGNPGRGCANSNSTLGGAHLFASGTTNPNTIVLTCDGVNNNTLCTFFRGPNHNVQASVFGDGIKCVNSPIFRFGQQNSGVSGNELFTVAVPAPTELPGTTMHYAVHYRNPVGGFCLPALFNASNGYTIGW